MSKLKLLSSVAVAALIAMPAFAQTSSSPTTSPSTSRPVTTAPSGSASTHANMPSDLRAWKVSDLVGKNVYTSNDEKIGDINEVVVPKAGGQPMAVIGVGGFLGIGEKEAAVALDDLKVQGDKIIGAGLTKESLKQHADYKKDKDNYTKLDRNQVVGQASGVTGGTSRSSSGSSTTGSSTTGSSSMNGASSKPSTTGSTGSSTMGTSPSGSSGSSGAVGSTGSSSSPSGSGSSSTMGSSTGSSSMGSPNPAATSNPPDNATATKKQ